MLSNKNHRFLIILMLTVITICMLLFAGCQAQDKNRDSSEGAELEGILDRGC